MKRLSLVLLIALFGLLVACSPTGAGEEAATITPTAAPALDTVPPPSAEGEEAATPAPESEGQPEAELPESAVILFHREGGIAGVSEEWTVFADGRVVDAAGNEFQLEPAAVTAMLATIQATGFMELDNSQAPVELCCDRFVYTLTVRLDDRTHSMTMVDGQENVAPALEEAINTVQSAIERLTS
jgi:hypothetical protein